MSTLQNYDEHLDIMLEESAEEKQARLNRLRAAEIKRRFTAIDRERIRPLAAVVAGTGTDEDRDKLARLEQEAQALRDELTGLEGT